MDFLGAGALAVGGMIQFPVHSVTLWPAPPVKQSQKAGWKMQSYDPTPEVTRPPLCNTLWVTEVMMLVRGRDMRDVRLSVT